MKVAVAHSVTDVAIAERPMPVPGPGEAVLKVHLCGICTSDVMDWYVRQKAPSVLGHEPVGILEAVGPDVSNFQPGDRVFVHHHVPCGQCHACLRDSHTCCQMFKETALDPGGFAEYLRIPAHNLAKDTLRLPDHLDDVHAAFIEPVACSIRALNRLRPQAEDTILIIGLGVMGLLNGLCARERGVARVIGSDFVASRRAKALALGFDGVIDPDRGPIAEQVSENNGRLADLVLVGPGTVQAMEHGLAAAGPGATVLFFSPTPPQDLLALDTNRLYFQEQTIATSYSSGPEDTRAALALLAQGKLPVTELVTHRLGLKQVGEGLRLLAAKDTALKVLVDPWK